MREIHKQIVTDEHQQPVAVQISYPDWLEIERELELRSRTPRQPDLSRYADTIRLTEEPLTYQARIRDEWT